ncbi:MAG: type 4a pilus biogenesis protein PilO [Candidatus Paceibacterota bacterium]|jgi:Tfp pilus assembly protein PilO
MNFIFPLILIASSFAVFFGYVDPNYKGNGTPTGYDDPTAGVLFLRDERTKYKDIVESSNMIVSKRDELIAKKLTISESDRAKLERLLPSNIDNIRLIIEISKIAERRGLLAKNISVGDMTKTTSETIGVDNTPYGTLSLKFSVNSSYTNFLNLLQDLENNLRLVDITDITFNSTESGFYDFSVSLNTYWLK